MREGVRKNKEQREGSEDINDISTTRPRWQPVKIKDWHLRSHGKIGDFEQSSATAILSIEMYLPSSITETTIPRPVILFSQTPVTLISCPMNRKLSCNKSNKNAATTDNWKSVFLLKFSRDYKKWEWHMWKENYWAILPLSHLLLYLAKTK